MKRISKTAKSLLWAGVQTQVTWSPQLDDSYTHRSRVLVVKREKHRNWCKQTTKCTASPRGREGSTCLRWNASWDQPNLNDITTLSLLSGPLNCNEHPHRKQCLAPSSDTAFIFRGVSIFCHAHGNRSLYLFVFSYSYYTTLLEFHGKKGSAVISQTTEVNSYQYLNIKKKLCCLEQQATDSSEAKSMASVMFYKTTWHVEA